MDANQIQTRSIQDRELRIRMAIHAEVAMQRFGKNVCILHFDNIYTPIFASLLRAAGAAVSVAYPVLEPNWNHYMDQWCHDAGYHPLPIHVSFGEARDIGIEAGQPSLHRSIMYLVAEGVELPWIAIPEELRIIKTDSGWQVAKTKSLRLWQEHHHEFSHMLWASDELATTYVRYPLVQDLINDRLPGKRSNRSSDRAIWSRFFTLDYPQYNYRLATKPLWEMYGGELILRNEHNISQITYPVGVHNESD